MHLRMSTLSLIFALALVTPIYAQPPAPHQAGLIIVHGDGSVVSACITFPEESISGAELLRRSGQEVTLGVYGGLGYGVCAIGDEGCPESQDCFCQCRSSPCAYWVYSHRNPDGSWAISGVGASSWQVRDGDVDGWVWGDGSTAPSTTSFEQICSPDAASSVAPTAVSEAPSPTTTAIPDPTLTPAHVPSSPIPTATSQPLAENPQHNDSPLSYIVFAIAALGLAGWLIVVGTRRRHT